MSGSFGNVAVLALRGKPPLPVAFAVLHDRTMLATLLEAHCGPHGAALVEWLRDPAQPFGELEREFLEDLLADRERGRPVEVGMTFTQLAMIAKNYDILTTRSKAKAARAEIAERFKVSERTVNSWIAEYKKLPPEHRADWFKGE